MPCGVGDGSGFATTGCFLGADDWEEDGPANDETVIFRLDGTVAVMP